MYREINVKREVKQQKINKNNYYINSCLICHTWQIKLGGMKKYMKLILCQRRCSQQDIFTGKNFKSSLSFQVNDSSDLVVYAIVSDAY